MIVTTTLCYKWRAPQRCQRHRRAPFWEESVPALVDLVGAERVCFGSDYPHAEGLAEPLSWRFEIADLPAADVDRIMSTNMYELMRMTPV